MTAAFVTGTGTDIGKTFVAAGLLRHWREGGRMAEALKPVVSGFDPLRWHESDPASLLAAMGRPPTLAEVERISPWRFTAPLSPDMAAAWEGRVLVFSDLIDHCRHALAARPGALLIEGIGGIMVPLDAHHTVLDWMTVLRIPILLVTGSYVGTVSHTLTALEVLARRNLDIAALVVCESSESAASLPKTVATLSRFADAIDVIGVPRLLADERHPAFARIAALL